MRQLRDEVQSPVSLDYFQKRMADGWTLTAIEWEKQGEEDAGPVLPEGIAAPYGIAVVPDTARLQPRTEEVEVLQTILELIVVEKGVSQIAAELNNRGFATRSGKLWTSTAVFNLLPRLIEAAPEILKRDDWQERRTRAAS
jgi:recombinase